MWECGSGPVPGPGAPEGQSLPHNHWHRVSLLLMLREWLMLAIVDLQENLGKKSDPRWAKVTSSPSVPFLWAQPQGSQGRGGEAGGVG